MPPSVPHLYGRSWMQVLRSITLPLLATFQAVLGTGPRMQPQRASQHWQESMLPLGINSVAAALTHLAWSPADNRTFESDLIKRHHKFARNLSRSRYKPTCPECMSRRPRKPQLPGNQLEPSPSSGGDDSIHHHNHWVI
jgi:hypothetical protein